MSEPTLIANVVADGLARLTSSYAKQPNIRKILTALLTPRQELENQLFNVYVQRRLRTATLYVLPTTNSVLDAIGALIGQPRDTMSDATYQQILLLAAAARRSNGVVPDWSKFATLLLATSGGPAEYLQGTAAFDFGVFDMTLPPIEVAATLGRAVPNGMRAAFVYSTWASSLNFTWGSVYSGGAGTLLGSVYSPSLGGLLVAAQPMPTTVGSGTTSEWTPPLQAGLLAWGRADQGLTIPSPGNVTAWADLSGHGSNMALAAGAGQDCQFIASAINGQPAVRMLTTGGNAWLIGTLGSHFSGTALTILMIGKVTFVSGGRIISAFPTGSNDTATNAFTLYQSNATTAEIFNAANVAGVATPNRTSPVAGVYSARFDGTNATARFNGTDGTPGACTTTFSLDKFDFSDANGLENPLDACEWAVIDHALTPAEWALWSGYTTLRYGLAA